MFRVHYGGMRISKLVKLVHGTLWTAWWCYPNICNPKIIRYSGILIYRPCNFCFPIFIMRHLWSRIKFHINNVIYFRIHRSPELSFFRLYACKSRSWHSISHMDFLAWFVWEKNWSELFMWDPCCTPAPNVADCMYVYSLPVFICVSLSSLPTWPSVLSHWY
jgi:hypothetical protein